MDSGFEMGGGRRERRKLIDAARADILDAETRAAGSILAGDRKMKAYNERMNLFPNASHRRERGR